MIDPTWDPTCGDVPDVDIAKLSPAWVDTFAVERRCHDDCTIGPNADHHGTMSYRCMGERGESLPFPGEPSTLVDLGGGYLMHIFAEESS